MYYYILDPAGLSTQKFEEIQVRLHGYLAEFNILGEFGRISSLRRLPDLIEVAASRGVHTLVACGNDDTFNLMIALSKSYDFVFGFIPFDNTNSFLAKVFGLGNLFHSVKVLASRRTEEVDLVKVNNHHFISYLEFGVTVRSISSMGFFGSLKALSSPTVKVTVRIDDSYNLSVDCLGGMVVNTRAYSAKDSTIANPTDGLLDLILLEHLSRLEILRYRHIIMAGRLEEVPKTTMVKCKKVQFLEPRDYGLSLSGKVIAKFPAKVEIWPKGQKIIVGKKRTF